MRWATRAGIHIDRAATAWLIKTQIDPEAEFLYVEDIADVPDDATAFDMRGCELTHVGDDVTFETVLRRYDLADPVLWSIAEIVHQADLEDDRYDAPEAAGLDVLIRAVSSDHTDEQTQQLAAELFTSLERHLRQRVLNRWA